MLVAALLHIGAAAQPAALLGYPAARACNVSDQRLNQNGWQLVKKILPYATALLRAPNGGCLELRNDELVIATCQSWSIHDTNQTFGYARDLLFMDSGRGCVAIRGTGPQVYMKSNCQDGTADNLIFIDDDTSVRANPVPFGNSSTEVCFGVESSRPTSGIALVRL
jgi:hypothetical protein